MYESLIDVDRWIGRILAALRATGRLQNSLIVFASDNGYLFGEHRLDGKEVPYEESIRVPIMLRWDAAHLTPATNDHIVANVDLAQTWANAAGTNMDGNEGSSLLPLLSGDPAWRQELLIEHYGGPLKPSYCGVRTESGYKYVRYSTGEEELYDVSDDQYELNNLASDPAFAAVLQQLQADTRQLCDPPPPGFSWMP